tara:strand:- start:101352 stop:101606 length:255 start_codon:yes stop_codon:yes gene_type:complete
MVFYFYILYSNKLDRFYLGHTGDSLDERLKKHLSNHKGFTSRAKDWEVCYFETFSAKSLAYQRELQVKRMKSRKYIENLLAIRG